jgi:hypothetical protein
MLTPEWLGCGLGDRVIVVTFPAATVFLFPHSIQAGPEAHLMSYSVGIWGCFTGVMLPAQEV